MSQLRKDYCLYSPNCQREATLWACGKRPLRRGFLPMQNPRIEFRYSKFARPDFATLIAGAPAGLLTKHSSF